MRALKCLDLSDNLIHAVGASALANAFYDDDHLEVLDVSGNPILDAGGKQLATLVLKNSCLRHLGLNRCDLGENFVRAMDKALHVNTTLMAIEANENGLSLTKLKVLADGAQSNHELTLLWQDPVKYDLSALSGPMQRLVLDKLHFLPLDVIHLMYSNKTIMENEPFQRLVEEMAPPSRKRLVLSGEQKVQRVC